MSTDSGRTLFLSSPINVPVWDQAGWLGVAYLHDPTRKAPPAVGLIFKNERAARQIFAEWRDRLGPIDSHEDLRIAIIEGDVPGFDAGYFVHIGFEPARVVEHAKEQGHHDPDKLLLALVTRIHRMNPPSTSTNLAEFKADFALHGSYELMPVIEAGGNYDPVPELALTKRELQFRHIRDVGPNDIDRLCIAPTTTVFPPRAHETEH